MTMQQTHGRPQPRRLTVDTTGGQARFTAETIHLQVSCEAGVVRIYFTEAAYIANTDEFIELDSAVVSESFYEGPANVSALWLRGVGAAATVTMIGYAKKV